MPDTDKYIWNSGDVKPEVIIDGTNYSDEEISYIKIQRTKGSMGNNQLIINNKWNTERSAIEALVGKRITVAANCIGIHDNISGTVTAVNTNILTVSLTGTHTVGQYRLGQIYFTGGDYLNSVRSILNNTAGTDTINLGIDSGHADMLDDTFEILGPKLPLCEGIVTSVYGDETLIVLFTGVGGILNQYTVPSEYSILTKFRGKIATTPIAPTDTTLEIVDNDGEIEPTDFFGDYLLLQDSTTGQTSVDFAPTDTTLTDTNGWLRSSAGDHTDLLTRDTVNTYDIVTEITSNGHDDNLFGLDNLTISGTQMFGGAFYYPTTITFDEEPILLRIDFNIESENIDDASGIIEAELELQGIFTAIRDGGSPLIGTGGLSWAMKFYWSPDETFGNGTYIGRLDIDTGGTAINDSQSIEMNLTGNKALNL